MFTLPAKQGDSRRQMMSCKYLNNTSINYIFRNVII